MRALIAVLEGDGIGPEVIRQAVRVVDVIAGRRGHEFDMRFGLIGGAAMDSTGAPLPAETLELCLRSDAVLLGAVGGPRWDDPRAAVRPEQGLLALRRALGVYANLRPVAAYPALAGCSPIRRSFLRGVNMLVVRELAGGIYFGGKVRAAGAASDTCSYSTGEIERVARVACRMAQGRRCKLTSVDKANVLETSRLWRLTVERVVRDEFPNVRLEHLLVDAAAMHIIRRPADFDVIVTENMFGDILTDEASVLAGSPGMLPSASLGDNSRGLFEPAHGSAPDIASKGIANPYGAILSAGMMLEHSLGLHKEADAVEAAVRRAIRAGVVTPDIAGKGAGPASTVQAGDAVIDGLRSRLLPCRR